jgi:hypothetical protein
LHSQAEGEVNMKEKFKFTLVETGTLEESLQMTPWERMLENDKTLDRLQKLELFMENFIRGYNFI